MKHAHGKWPWLLIAMVLLWATWGCWKVLDLALKESSGLDALRFMIESAIKEGSWPVIVLFPLLLAAWLIWCLLPLWVFLFFALVLVDRTESIGDRLAEAFSDIAKQIVSLSASGAVVVAAWLFLVSFGGLLDVIGLLLLLAWLVSIGAYLGWRQWQKVKHAQEDL